MVTDVLFALDVTNCPFAVSYVPVPQRSAVRLGPP